MLSKGHAGKEREGITEESHLKGSTMRAIQCSMSRIRSSEDRKKGMTTLRKKAPPIFSRVMRLWLPMASAKSSTT